MKLIQFVFLILTMTACAKIEKQTIVIETDPDGAKIVVAERHKKTGMVVEKKLGISPVDFEINHKEVRQVKESSNDDELDFVPQSPTSEADSKYVVTASKEGYFTEKKPILDYDALAEAGKFIITLEKSPLWWDTEPSDATNEWINLTVSSEISDVDMWQRLIAAVTKRYHELKEYDFKSGYLATVYKTKLFDTSRGTFLLRSKFIATVMGRDPLTYRLTLISEWANREGKIWHPYPRATKEDARLILEIMDRFQAY